MRVAAVVVIGVEWFRRPADARGSGGADVSWLITFDAETLVVTSPIDRCSGGSSYDD